jgi:hypothetical protein
MGGSRSESAVGYLNGFLDHGALYYGFTCSVAMWIRPSATFPIRPESYKSSPQLKYLYLLGKRRVPMPVYCLQDCHYFYRSALRHLNIATSISPLYA